jgi:hypothetical protein
MNHVVPLMSALTSSAFLFAGAADPYVKMTLGEHQRVSKTVKNTVSPVWDAACDELLFTVCELDTRAAGQSIAREIHAAVK